jgi:outer membrane protein assembly factor BamD (BamD/ComL family)
VQPARTESAETNEQAVASRPQAVKRQAAAATPPFSSLAEELKLVTAAQAALDSGRHDDALALLQQHARRFPHGALAEEREAARVEALCGLGREHEAIRLADRFVIEFPGSPRSSRIRAACTPEGR